MNSNWPCQDRHLPREAASLQGGSRGPSRGVINAAAPPFLASSKEPLDSPLFCQGRTKTSQMFGETRGGEVFVQSNIFTKQIKFTVDPTQFVRAFQRLRIGFV
jgi:hypothetical protein